MKINKKKSAVLMAMMVVLSAGLCGCSSNNEEARMVQIGTSNKEFRFGCYSTPYYENIGDVPYAEHPDQNTFENWKNIADCGFNYAIPINDVTHDQIIKTLTRAQEQGIKVLIMDYLSSGLPQLIKRSENKSYEEVYASILQMEDTLIKRYTEYATYSSFAGIQVFDEPAASFYNAIAAGQDWWYEHFPQYEYYVNLLPSYSSYVQLFGASAENGYKYPEYVEQFVETSNPSYISYDHYPFIRSGVGATIRPQYLYDLEVFAEASKKYEIPFYCYQLCTKHLSYPELTSYREYAWQAYTAMAYGCQGLQTFKYWAYMSPEVNSLNLGNGLVDRDGNITPFYYAVQEVNREIKSFEEYYMNFTWEGTMPIGPSGAGAYALLRFPLKSLYGVKKVSASEDTIIGQFRDKWNNKAYMVVNYSSPYRNVSTEVTMHFENVKKVLICKKGRQILQTVENNTLKMTLGSGEGYFVIPVL